MTDRPCRYRSHWWQVWKPERRQWYGGIAFRPDGHGGIEAKSTLRCGCGCRTKAPDFGVWKPAPTQEASDD